MNLLKNLSIIYFLLLSSLTSYSICTTPSLNFISNQGTTSCPTNKFSLTCLPSGTSEVIWNFGDGTIVHVYQNFEVPVEHVYTIQDTYSVTATITHTSTFSTNPLTLSITHDVTGSMIGTVPVIEEVGTPESSLARHCLLQATFQIPCLSPILESTILQIVWDFGDGSSTLAVGPGSFTNQVVHSYNLAGNYNITATIYFIGGATQVISYNNYNWPYSVPPDLTNYNISFDFNEIVGNPGMYEFKYTGNDIIGVTGLTFSYSLEIPTSPTPTIINGSGDLQYGDIIATNIPIGPNDVGDAVLTVSFQGVSLTCTQYFSRLINEQCTKQFSPKRGEQYWISAWVSEDHPIQQTAFSNSYLRVEYLDVLSTTVVDFDEFHPSGKIIDEWQRIAGKLTIPTGAFHIRLKLMNDNATVDAYFDDIRIHPFNGGMKSYVYDGETFWLTAELDDNNFATFYEYDQEGGLIRIKKETENGVMTIQETRSNSSKTLTP